MTQPTPALTHPLGSWNDGPAKQAIVDFVARVTTPGSPDFVPMAERIATFDNDGTLWCEKPTYAQVFFVLARLHELVQQRPELATQQPYQVVLTGGPAALHSLSLGELAQVVLAVHAGLTAEAFTAQAEAFFASATHPRFQVPFPRLAYVPMLELLDYLRANDFRVFIVTGGGVEFVRAISEEAYGVTRDDVVGSAVQLTFERQADKVQLVRQAALWGSPDEGAPKAINIQAHIGRRPILAAGNSSGDAAMLEYAQTGSHPALCLLVNHDDDEREYAYESQAATVAQAEPILTTAARLGWTVVSMKHDWGRIFSGTNE